MSDEISDTGASAAEKPYLMFEGRSGDASTPTPAGEVLLAWHAALSSHKGSRQVFQRGIDPERVIRDPQYQRLRRTLARRWHVNDDTLVRIVQVVSTVKTHDAVPLGQTFNTKKVGGRAAVSEKRATVILKTESVPQLARLLRSTIRMVGHKASVTGIADLMLRWEHPIARKYARRELVTSYFENA